MKKVLLATAIAATMISAPAMAVSYTSTGGYTNMTSTSRTITDNVTIIDGYKKVTAQDVSRGGLDNTNSCSALDCDKSDNVTSGHSKTITHTDLVLRTQGETTRTATTASCFSGSDMNGLAHQEASSVEDFSISGYSTITATGTITEIAKNWATTTNGGADNGSLFEKTITTTTINEVTENTFSGTGQIVTFSSSVGN